MLTCVAFLCKCILYYGLGLPARSVRLPPSLSGPARLILQLSILMSTCFATVAASGALPAIIVGVLPIFAMVVTASYRQSVCCVDLRPCRGRCFWATSVERFDGLVSICRLTFHWSSSRVAANKTFLLKPWCCCIGCGLEHSHCVDAASAWTLRRRAPRTNLVTHGALRPSLRIDGHKLVVLIRALDKGIYEGLPVVAAVAR